MSIKGTLETFNLRELLQMLAFNQKDGTLVLETERGPRTLHVEDGRVALVSGDRHASLALARVLKRHAMVPEDRMDRAEQIAKRSERFLGEVLKELGALDDETFTQAYEEAVAECLFDLQLGSIQRFEFVEGHTLAPDGKPGQPIEPRLVVDALLLDLTRKIDTWSVLCESVPSLQEVFEGTGIEVDLSGQEDLDVGQADRVVPKMDGYRTLDQVADASDVDRYTVLHLAVALLQGGAIRPVPSEDLVARAEDLLGRGEAATALPLLRRALERGDAPVSARLRLADALESSGDPVAAAAELDTFATLADEGQALEVFDALHRALDLRDDDPVTAARLCDHYLRHRPWLKAKRSEALAALRTLISGAQAAGRPLDAAQRLACFIQNSDAPSEDSNVLADLYAAGGERQEAASALFRRAEDLLAVQRVAPARDLLRRALEYDPSRADARRRLSDLEGEASRRRHHKRIVILLSLLGLLVVGAGGAWWLLNREATKAVRDTRENAEAALREAEERVVVLVAGFRALANEAERSATVPGNLPAAARQLLADAKALGDGIRAPIGAYAAELERSVGGPSETNDVIVRGLDQRRQNLLGRAQSALAEIARRADALRLDGEKAFEAGSFAEARRLLVGARNLGFEDTTVRDRAHVLLAHIDDYRTRFERAQGEAQAARARGDLAGAASLVMDALVEHQDSDLTHALRIPVELTSNPAGAGVLLGGKTTGLVTPCVLEYSPFEDTHVTLRLPGRTSTTVALPDYARIQKDRDGLRTWVPKVSADLPEGVRWRIPASTAGRLTALWASGEVPVVLALDGTTTHSVDARAGVLGAAITAKVSNPMRLGGWLADGTEWRILGHRTLQVRTRSGEVWDRQALGRLERAPVLHDDVVVFVDEAGTLYGFALDTGTELWRRNLGAPPSQAPYASRLGILIATLSGSAVAVEPTKGTPRTLAPAGRGLTLALPLGEGALLVGTGAGGLKRVSSEGAVEVLGDTRPVPDREAYVGAEGVAWVTAEGVEWLAVGARSAVRIEALGSQVQRLTGGAGGADIPAALYAVGADHILKVVDPTKPGQRLWAAPLRAACDAPPVVLGDAVFILVDGGLVAVER